MNSLDSLLDSVSPLDENVYFDAENQFISPLNSADPSGFIQLNNVASSSSSSTTLVRSNSPRLFGTDITNGNEQHLAFGISGSSSRLYDFDFGHNQYPFNNHFLYQPNWPNTSMNQCLFTMRTTTAATASISILDSPNSSPESNFSLSLPKEECPFFDNDYNFSTLPLNDFNNSLDSLNLNQDNLTVKTEQSDSSFVKLHSSNHSNEVNNFSESSKPIKFEETDSISVKLATHSAGDKVSKSSQIGDRRSKRIFPFRLWDLASDKNFEPLSWNTEGTKLLVNLETINRKLASICRSKKFASFLRQLHLYGFRKDARCLPNKRVLVKQALYHHPCFRRDRPNLLSKINRLKAF